MLAEDLAASSAQDRWPFFAPLAASAGVRAVYSVPVVIGTEAAGALDLYGAEPMPPADFRLQAATLVADAAAEVVVRWYTAEGGDSCGEML